MIPEVPFFLHNKDSMLEVTQQTCWWLHALSHSSRNGGEWSGSPHGRLIPEEKVLDNDCIGRLNGSLNQSGRFSEEKICWLWFLRRPARKPRDSYPDFSEFNCQRTFITDERIRIRCLTSWTLKTPENACIYTASAIGVKSGYRK